MIKEKCIVMFSGGLDSRLALKIMQEKGLEVLALFFKLPFGTGCCNENCSFNFSQMQGVKLEIFDCTKGKLLKEYLEIIKKAEHGTGAGVNPCVDCRIFMLKKAKEFADNKKIERIVTGEVLGERPMSQTKRAMNIIEEETGLKRRIFRPLTELYGIKGRRREKQIALAEKFKINFPPPAGGCLLCEKALKKRFKYLLNRGMSEEEINLAEIGRHFVFDDCWVVFGRDEKENKIIEASKAGEIIIPEFTGPSAVILPAHPSLQIDSKQLINNAQHVNREVNSLKKFRANKDERDKLINKVNELIKAYSKRGNLKDREKFEEEKM